MNPPSQYMETQRHCTRKAIRAKPRAWESSKSRDPQASGGGKGAPQLLAGKGASQLLAQQKYSTPAGF